jgi:hypothetical protein
VSQHTHLSSEVVNGIKQRELSPPKTIPTVSEDIGFQACSFAARNAMSLKAFMPQIVLAVGLDAQNNVTSLYVGASEAAAQVAVDAAGKADTSISATCTTIPRLHSPCATARA